MPTTFVAWQVLGLLSISTKSMLILENNLGRELTKTVSRPVSEGEVRPWRRGPHVVTPTVWVKLVRRRPPYSRITVH